MNHETNVNEKSIENSESTQINKDVFDEVKTNQGNNNSQKVINSDDLANNDPVQNNNPAKNDENQDMELDK